MAQVILWNPSTKPHPVIKMLDIDHGFFPIRTCGAHQLASWLRQNGYSVKVIDYCNEIGVDNLVNITLKNITNDTIVIGVSTTFLHYDNWPDNNGYAIDRDFLEPVWLTEARSVIENRFPNIKWVAGGVNTQMCDRSEWIKIENKAEDSFLKYLNEITIKLSTVPTFDIKTSLKKYIKNDYITPWDVLPIELGRGCIFKCKFCGFDQIGKKPGTYLKNPEIIRNEILEHYYNWGVTRFTYVDDTVNESVEKVEALASIAQSLPFDLEWIGYLRADLIWSNPITTKLLKDSGLRSGFFGIETFEETSSKIIGKGWSSKHGKEWLLEIKDTWKDEITFELGLITGLPGQTPDQLRKDIQWLIDNDMYAWWINPLSLGKNSTKSEFERNQEKYGFTFPRPNEVMYWENEKYNWTWKTAFDEATNLKKMSKGHIGLAAFSLGNFGGLGYKFKDLMHLKYRELPIDLINQQKIRYLTDYIKSQLQ